jgi:predicted transcriptional regulator
MITDFRSLAPGNSLQEAIEHVLAGFQHDFPVLDQGRLVGVLTRDDLLKSLAQKGPQTLVARTMTEKFEVGDPADMLDLVLARLQSCRCRTLLVLKGGELVGILTMDNVGEFLMFQSALRGDPRAGRIGSSARPGRVF